MLIVMLLRLISFAYIAIFTYISMITIGELIFDKPDKRFKLIFQRLKLVLIWPFAIFGKRGRQQLNAIFTWEVK